MKQKSSRLIKLTSRSSIMEPPRFRSDRGAWTNTEREESQLARKEAVIHAVAWAYHQSEMVLLRSYITICITLFYAKIQRQGEYLNNLTDNAVYDAMRFANESEVASRLHAQQPSALLSTYPGYHGKTFIHRHSKHVRGNSSLGLSSLAHVKRVSITAIKRVHQDGDRSRSNSNTMSGSWTMHGNGLVQELPATGDTVPKQPLTNSGTVWDATSPQANLLMKVIEELEARKASTVSVTTVRRQDRVSRYSSGSDSPVPRDIVYLSTCIRVRSHEVSGASRSSLPNVT
ncbi:unnamed protein product [Phytophthora fragariaefolia]|uniref:Unnamed protein product n=1 Tax=Phytophthora fragariaefolia TaxID=1490495 RepID=A0A9W6XPL7_9STRA|nr:unnamed protein product [Phytophthora fragariaefolia]